MHDLAESYAERVAAIIRRSNEARRAALEAFEKEMAGAAAQADSEIAAEGVALEAGMQARMSALRGEPLERKELCGPNAAVETTE